ncbi:MAG: cysteine methyltransferase [Thermoleophilia bacterium]|nr:cysteine methyltransferase [Thermoleophilia bacterium]
MTAFDALLERSSAGFSHAAAAAGLVDVSVAELDTPLGRLLLAATDQGLVRVAFDTEQRDDVLDQLATSISPRVVEDPRQLDGVRTALDAYFVHARSLAGIQVDLRLVRGPFRQLVLAELRRIPTGEVHTYAELAAAAGRPNAVRSAGSGCATNPVPIIVPCHRVVRTGGALGGYVGGIERKAWLLEHERVASLDD